MMAAQLLRYGIQPLIIEARRGPDRTSEPETLNARSMELFRQLGLADQLVDSGMPAYVVPVRGRRRRIGTVSSGHLENPGTAFPFELFVSGEKLGRLLLGRLTENACPVVWNTRLLGLEQNDRLATVRVDFEGTVQQLSCKWVVGADGINSMVRQAVSATAEPVFLRQRCVLVGGAARAAGEANGQAVNINTGLQDAANIAWKLAYTMNGRVEPALLHTYMGERSAVAPTTQVAFAWMGDAFAERVFRLMVRKPVWVQRLFEAAAQLGIHYRESLLAAHYAVGRRIRAGDRLPFLPVFDEKTKTNTDLHRWCEKPGFVLLVLGTISHHHLHIISQWMRQKYPREMHLYYLPYSSANRVVFETFEVRTEGTKIVLIRPDMYIGYCNDMLNVSLTDTYMEEVIGWKPFGHVPENT